MAKLSEIDLSDVPWPANLLQCYRLADEMGPGDQLMIRVEDEDIKESLILILNAMPEHSYRVATRDGRFGIRVKRYPPGMAAEEGGGGPARHSDLPRRKT